MTNQPEALRLADELEELGYNALRSQVAAELRRLHEVNQELVEALESIAEYWNQDSNTAAMHDACWHSINTAKAALSKATGESNG